MSRFTRAQVIEYANFRRLLCDPDVQEMYSLDEIKELERELAKILAKQDREMADRLAKHDREKP